MKVKDQLTSLLWCFLGWLSRFVSFAFVLVGTRLSLGGWSNVLEAFQKEVCVMEKEGIIRVAFLGDLEGVIGASPSFSSSARALLTFVHWPWSDFKLRPRMFISFQLIVLLSSLRWAIMRRRNSVCIVSDTEWWLLQPWGYPYLVIFTPCAGVAFLRSCFRHFVFGCVEILNLNGSYKWREKLCIVEKFGCRVVEFGRMVG